MSGDRSDDDEQPVHEVYLDTYWVDKHEMTNYQYRLCVKQGVCVRPYQKDDYLSKQHNDHPVVSVNWYQASMYCLWAGGRLPTEAEWEKAARGTDARTYPWGESAPTCNLANFGGTSGCVGDTSAVGSYPAGASPYGAMDMAGNVREWVWDWYDSGYYSKSPLQNPTGPTSGEYRQLRGGSWDYPEYYVRSALRERYYPGYGWDSLGFRCVSPP